METIEGKAKEAIKHLEQKTRDNGRKFWCFKSDAPEWCQDLAYAAHNNGELLPDDHRYEFMVTALDAIAECGDDGDALHEYIDNSVDVYNYDLTQWVASTNWRGDYVDQFVEELGGYEEFFKALMGGQYFERSEVLGAVLSFLDNLTAKSTDS